MFFAERLLILSIRLRVRCADRNSSAPDTNQYVAHICALAPANLCAQYKSPEGRRAGCAVREDFFFATFANLCTVVEWPDGAENVKIMP